MFDAPLAVHHKVIGRWIADREPSTVQITRSAARQRIEKAFDSAVVSTFAPFQLADFRTVVFQGDDANPPAIAIVCDTVGQIDLGWIETDNVLRNTLLKRVAPLGWRAAAYKALAATLNCTLPVFGFDDLFKEYSGAYWDGSTEDADAIRSMVEYQGAELDDIDETMLPSAMKARRPDWMLAEKASPMKYLPPTIRTKIRALRTAHVAVMALGQEGNAWAFDFAMACDYVPGLEDCSHLPAMTLVPAEHFGRELDDVGQHGMQQGFMDIAGICPIADAGRVEQWFVSLQVGARYLAAAQDLMTLDLARI